MTERVFPDGIKRHPVDRLARGVVGRGDPEFTPRERPTPQSTRRRSRKRSLSTAGDMTQEQEEQVELLFEQVSSRIAISDNKHVNRQNIKAARRSIIRLVRGIKLKRRDRNRLEALGL